MRKSGSRSVPAGPVFAMMTMYDAPFDNFTDYWDDATGKPVVSCEEKREYCPDDKTLANMKTMSIWAEGVEGHVHLEVKSIAGYDCSRLP